MNISVKGKLLLGLVTIGIFFGVTFHSLLMPFFASQLIHCVASGVVFGLTNYFLVSLIYNKYFIVKEHNSRLRSELRTDKLTQLLNRRSFDEDVDLLRITGEVVSIIFIDVDEFRTINNSYGNLAGDIILKKVSNIITDNIRVTDSAYRYGGEEMVVLLKNCTKPLH